MYYLLYACLYTLASTYTYSFLFTRPTSLFPVSVGYALSLIHIEMCIRDSCTLLLPPTVTLYTSHGLRTVSYTHLLRNRVNLCIRCFHKFCYYVLFTVTLFVHSSSNLQLLFLLHTVYVFLSLSTSGKAPQSRQLNIYVVPISSVPMYYLLYAFLYTLPPTYNYSFLFTRPTSLFPCQRRGTLRNRVNLIYTLFP